MVSLVLSKVTGKLPDVNIDASRWPHLKALPLADPNFNKCGTIDLVLGINVLDDVMRLGIRRGQPGEPTAQLTAFGWVISGKTAMNTNDTVAYAGLHSTIQLEQLVHKFIDTEDVEEERIPSNEDQWTEEFFSRTHCRTNEANNVRPYMVRLPLKQHFDESKKLGRSYYQLELASCNLNENLPTIQSSSKHIQRVYTDI